MAHEGSRIPSLDGLRALSITLVVLGHLGGTRYSPVPLFFEDYANFGVRVFFVISGYLISTILIKEHTRTGTIILRGFYIRRFFRIFPAAYAFLIATLLFGEHTLRGIDIFTAFTYLVNYNLSRPWAIGHLWSLSVEEQFYLLWPLTLLLFFRKGRTLALAGIVLAPFMRAGFKMAGFSSDAIGNYFPCVADSIATGCLLALLQPEMGVWAARLYRPGFVLVPLLALSVPLWPHLSHRIGVPAYQLLGITVMNVGIALCLDIAIRRRYALLNHPALVWVGVLSYSLYLWQQPFLNRNVTTWYSAFPVNLILAVGCATLSFYCVERPFLRMRERYFPVKATETRRQGLRGN